MKIQPGNTRTMEGAGNLLQSLSAHYDRTGGKGRILFTGNDRSQITGTSRSRGLWANLRSIGSNRYQDSKTDFLNLVRTAYPRHAERIISFIEARQQATGVRKMLTPGMIRAAVRKAGDLETMGRWQAGDTLADMIRYPNGRRPARRDLAAAIGLMKDGRKPDLGLTGNPTEDAQMKSMFQENLSDTSTFVACHDTADQFQSIMGKPETERTAGGKGRDNRIVGIDLAIETLRNGPPCVVSIKATATADGHSFSLVKKPDGTVDVLEAWASGQRECDIGALLNQCKKNLPLETVVEALENIKSRNPETRTRGYTALSTAYNDSARYELRRDPHRGERISDLRDDDGNISLVVRTRELKPKQEIMDEIERRLLLVDSFKTEILLTDKERRALRRL